LAEVFLDVAVIQISAGKGGDGCLSMRRESHVPRGGPDGGNGGRGGHVYFVATNDSSTLLDFRYRRRYQAPDGEPGRHQNMTGADGDDVVIPVPCGTSVIDTATGNLIGDLVERGQRLLVATGGRGGKGNWEFRSARNQAPTKTTQGRVGEAKEIRLELRLIADIGLVGLPNAGKSTLLSVVTAARPKVADYPFTTLVPNLGIVDLGEYQSCTLADIPGLIEGASEGRGLGHEFLRHIERTRALLFMVDAAYDAPTVALDTLFGELTEYDPRLAALPIAVVVTKADLLDDAREASVMAEAAGWCQAHGGRETLLISAVTSRGIDQLRHLMRRLLAVAAA
jgi:GTPase